MKIAQWAPSGNALDGIPSEIMRVLAVGDKTFGYGYGPGWTMIFGSEHGDVSVNPKDWVIRDDDGSVRVVPDDGEPQRGNNRPEAE